MDEIMNIPTIDAYNKLFGVETLHPLVSVVDFTKSKQSQPYLMNVGLYAIFLKEELCGAMRYGRSFYDYEAGTVVCFAPGQVVGASNPRSDEKPPKTRGVLFHPDLIKGTALAQEIKRYSFFSYLSNEALHLSESERRIVRDCMDKIQLELEHAADKHSKRLIVANIELLLDYCMRFYERQFVTRSEVNKDVLVRFEQLLDEYFQSEMPQTEGLPTVRYFADKVCLSPNYFGDLIKKETGKTAQENIQNKIVNLAKERIAGSSKTVSQISYDLGFQYPQHLNRVFKRVAGCTPNEYRAQI